MIRLTDEQRRLAEENMPLVGYVIARCIGFRPAPQDGGLSSDWDGRPV